MHEVRELHGGCPVYIETKKEGSVARGKIRLIDALLSGDLEYTEGLEERIGLCLTCMACVAKCPCGVKVDKIYSARELLLLKTGVFIQLRKRYSLWLNVRSYSISV
jgi:glycolate oxidase iron-sulfur subunit